MNDGKFLNFQKLMTGSKFNIHMCKHGFIEIKCVVNSDDLSDTNLEILITFIQNHIENKIQRCFDIFDYEKSVSKEELSTVLQGENYLEYVPPNEPKPPFLYLIEKYRNNANQILELRYTDYLKSIDKKHQINEINILSMLYKIYRGHYLKLFHSDKRCCIINNEDHLQSIIDEIGSILNSTTKYFKEFNEQQNFILNNDRFDDVHVICMDIEKFTFNVENQFSSSIVEQLEKFSILSKWVNLWLDNQVNKQPEQFDIPLTKNDFWMKCMGDGYLIAFKRPNYPFELAKYIKKLENDSSKNTSKLRVRIGLNTGQVRSVLDSIGNEDLIGPGINFAARTMSLSKENHLLASNSFKTNLTQLMGEEIPGDNILRIGYVKNNKIEFYNIFDSDYGTADPPETSDKPMT